jgi:hypothetical protein
MARVISLTPLELLLLDASSARPARCAAPAPREVALERLAHFVDSFAIAASSISSWRTRRSASSSSSGEESISIRSREADSSTRSIALSGRKRSAM